MLNKGDAVRIKLDSFWETLAGTYFAYKKQCDLDFETFSEIIAAQNAHLRKLERGRTLRNWLLFLSVCFTLFVMLYDAGVLF